MSQSDTQLLRLAIPSDGEMYDTTLSFFRECGISVRRGNSRRYTGDLHSLPDVLVLFQRASDITSKIEEGSADIGIVGLDRFRESHVDDGEALIIADDLGYSQCELVLAVPQSWMDVSEVADLGDLALEFREKGRTLRVATKYPRITQRFFFSHGINYFTIVESSGTLEAAPLMGFADVIVDITSTGTTLRENQLKTIADGSLLRSQACLIGNRTTLQNSERKQETARYMIERIEAYIEARQYFGITANIQGGSATEVASAILKRPNLAGLNGPTISPVYTSEGDDWYAASVVVPHASLQESIDYFRSIGGVGISVVQPRYVYHGESSIYRNLRHMLQKG